MLGVTHDSCSEDTYSNLLQQYHQLEQEMGQVAETWLEYQKRIDDYVDEQVTVRTKVDFLKEDWEAFRQRHFIEQLNGSKAISGENNFTDTMRHLLSSRLSISDCPNCNFRHRCTCDDCSLSHILMCGIMDSPATDDVHSNQLPLQIDSAPDYLSQMHLRSISSGSSGSSSSSPFTDQQIDRQRLILADNSSGSPFNTENEDISAVSEKPDIYCINHYDNAEAVRNMNGIHRLLTDGVKNMALKAESPQQSSNTSSSSSVADAEEADEENGGNLPRAQEGDLMIGTNVRRKDEAKTDSSLSSYSVQPIDQEPACCECHVCKQEISGPSSSDTEVKCLPAGHQFRMPEKPAHPALHLYPHIHGQIPLHTIPHLPPPLIHPSLYTASPFAQNKALVQNNGNSQQALSTPFQDNIYPNGFGSTTDWKSSNFLSIWESEVMNEKNWNASTSLQEELPGSAAAAALSELIPNVLPVTSRNEGMVITESKKRENILKKKCLYHCQDASFMDTKKVVMATSSATSSVSCTATTVQSSNNQFKVSSKRSSSLGDVFHNISSEDHRCSALAAPQNPTNFVPLPFLSPVVLPPASAPHLPSPNASSFSRVTTTAPSFVDSHSGLYPMTVPPLSTTESLISAPSSVCSDPDCEGHHCENSRVYNHQQYDGEESQDEDSCSEHSSSTSTSTNQKEGKYCDCCYCEFFGHGGPPAAPTSRNYAEMREKLRLRLTKKKEGQPRQPELIQDRENVVDHRKVEDLLQFINSPEAKPVSSSRTAKRARHKQKKLKEKAHIETKAREKEHHQLLEQQQQEDRGAQQLQELQDIKKKKKERTSTNCQQVQVHTQNCQVMMKPSPDIPENIQNEFLDEIETSSESLSKHADHVEQGQVYEKCFDPSNPINGRDSKLLFNTEMTVKSHEPLSLLLNIMHHHTEDNNKEQITQINDLFSQRLKKSSKATDIQTPPKIKNKINSKIKVAELQSLAVSKKEEKKVSTNKAKQINPVTKSPFVRGSFFPNEQLHNKLLLQESPQPKGKSKKNKKKKSDKGNSSIDDVFLPKDVDLDSVEMDETEREVEHFKRFCLDSARQTRQRLSINWSNFSLKKATFAVH
ncbi:protein FAM193A isoform X2 [Lacerta agilis]|uniref:protein FAM193A isoform X2 n=1 Tax=Lacerta agilis TaxID=80427 RepID=UPI00141A51B7|nr:protein FAM193A isoform X2 [Lacerta agilis]